MNEAGFLVDELQRRHHRLEAVLVNRLVPSRLVAGANARASELERSSDLVDRALAAAERELSAVASREQVAMQRMSGWEASVLASESRGGDITDVGALLALGEALHRR